LFRAAGPADEYFPGQDPAYSNNPGVLPVVYRRMEHSAPERDGLAFVNLFALNDLNTYVTFGLSVSMIHRRVSLTQKHFTLYF
jgi:hypothetical protein